MQARSVLLLLLGAGQLLAQAPVTLHLERPEARAKASLPAPQMLFWLEPVKGPAAAAPWPTRPPYRLLQKNKMFTPHLLVVPVGATVAFPNADPFFHNVFSLFDGSRFDLGLYEAGSTRDVTFSRKGFSFIFCNIHPEMAAIVVALDTPFWVSGAGPGSMTIPSVPAGTYTAHLWIEGQDAAQLDHWTHLLQVNTGGPVEAGSFTVQASRIPPHLNEFGHEYAPESPAY